MVIVESRTNQFCAQLSHQLRKVYLDYILWTDHFIPISIIAWICIFFALIFRAISPRGDSDIEHLRRNRGDKL